MPTIEFMDGFDHYATADFGQKWTSNVNSSFAVSAGNGRRGTNSARVTFGGGVAKYLVRTLTAQTTRAIGFSFTVSQVPNAPVELCSFVDAGTKQVELRLLADNTLRVTRNGTTLATSTSSLSSTVTYYIEFKATIDPTAGVYEVRVNGSSVGWIPQATGANTRNTANSSATQVRLGDGIPGSSNSPVGDFDDFYVADDFLGDIRVDTYLPNANGNSSQLTGSDGNSTDNYLLVDEASFSSADYVGSSTVGQKDTYGFQSMTHNPTTIHATQLNLMAAKDLEGARSVIPVTRSGGTDYDGTTVAVGTGYVDYREVRNVDPATSALWTQSGRNSAEFGGKVA